MPAAVPTVTVVTTAPSKPWYASRMLWLNVAVLMLAAAEARMGLLQQALPLPLFELIAFVLPVLNVGLRLVTSAALSTGATAPAQPPKDTP